MRCPALLAASLLLLGAGCAAPPTTVYVPGASGPIAETTGTVSVHATGEVEVAPDFATMQVTFTRRKPTEKAARTALRAAIIQLTALQKTLGLAKTDLSFSQVGVRPIEDWNAEHTARVAVAYEALETSAIVVRDLDRLEAVARAVLEISGDLGTISDISLGVDDASKAEAEARAMALSRANKKARQLAEGTGSALSGIQSLSESIGRPTSLLSKEVLFARIERGHGVGTGAKLYAQVTVQMVYRVQPR